MIEITSENWTYCHFKTEELKAFISISGAPSVDDARISFTVILTDLEHQELYQNEFNELDDAIKDLNHRYGHWELFDAENPPTADGCSSCDNKH